MPWWVGKCRRRLGCHRVDPAAVCNMQDVDLLVRRSDLDAVENSLKAAGFVRQNVAGVDLFFDGPHASVRDAVHIVLAGEKVRDHYTTWKSCARRSMNVNAPSNFGSYCSSRSFG